MIEATQLSHSSALEAPRKIVCVAPRSTIWKQKLAPSLRAGHGCGGESADDTLTHNCTHMSATGSAITMSLSGYTAAGRVLGLGNLGAANLSNLKTLKGEGGDGEGEMR